MKYDYLIGKRFGLLVVTGHTTDAFNHRLMVCRCDCGRRRETPPRKLLAGRSVDCFQCRRVEDKYGKKTPEYSVWSSMITRCTNPNHKAYHYYRKIKICDEWMDYKTFLTDMGKRPSKEFWIDRKNPKLGYNKENCEWVRKKFNCSFHKRNGFLDIEIAEIRTFLTRGIAVGKIAKFYDCAKCRIRDIKDGVSYTAEKN